MILRILFIVLIVLAIPIAGLLFLSSSAFEEERRRLVEHFMSEAITVPVKVKGPIEIGFSLAPRITIEQIVAEEDDLPTDMKKLNIKAVTLEIPLLPLLKGKVDLDDLIVDGLEVDIDIPEGRNTELEGVEAIANFVKGVVHSSVAGSFKLTNSVLNTVDQETGFKLRYDLDTVISQAKDGGTNVDAKGSLNGEPWSFVGGTKPVQGEPDKRTFQFAVQHPGFEADMTGDYTFGSIGDVVLMKATAKVPSLEKSMQVYGIKGDLQGHSEMSGTISGPLEALKLSDFLMTLTMDSGDVYTFTGGIDDLSALTGLDVKLVGKLVPKDEPSKREWPFFKIGVSGLSGRFEGSKDGVIVRDFHVDTTAVDTTLSSLGPITAQRLYKNKEGQLGLYGILILAGDVNNPALRISGTIKDIVDFKGVDLKGILNIPTTELLDITGKSRIEGLGRLAGELEVSDSDGTLGLESLSAKVDDSQLLKLSVDLSYDDLQAGDDFKLATKLDVPNFEALAKAFGADIADSGPITFDGSVAGGRSKLEVAGSSLIGKTRINGSLKGKVEKGKPSLSGKISSPIVYLSDLKRLQKAGSTYLEHVDHKDKDAVDRSKMWSSLPVDLEIDVTKIAGSGNDASHIRGKVTYLDGVVGLDPVTLTFLGGSASAAGKIHTAKTPPRFSLKGRVHNLQIGRVLKEMDVSFPVRGSLYVDYDLAGAGTDTPEISRTLSGSATSSLRNGWVGSDLINLTGMSLPAWLLSRGRDGGGADLVCVVAPFGFRDGRGTTHGFVMETREVQLVGVGYVNLRRETVDMRFKPHPLRKELIKVAQPFAIQGSLTHPTLHLEGAPVLNALAGSIAFPFNELDRLFQPKARQGEIAHKPCHIIRTSTRAEERETRREQRSGGGPLGLGILGGEGEARREQQRRGEPRREHEGLFGRGR